MDTEAEKAAVIGDKSKVIKESEGTLIYSEASVGALGTELSAAVYLGHRNTILSARAYK